MSDYFSISTFNILCPAYKRLHSEYSRESSYPQLWRSRHEEIIQLLLSSKSQVICLQEFWFSTDFIQLYESSLSHKFDFHYLQRTNWKDDGLVTLVAKETFAANLVKYVNCVNPHDNQNCAVWSGGQCAAALPSASSADCPSVPCSTGRFRLDVVDSRSILLNDQGDRVGLLLRIRMTPQDSGDSKSSGPYSAASTNPYASPSGTSFTPSYSTSSPPSAFDFLVLNVHLAFPHTDSDIALRRTQMERLKFHLETYQRDHGLFYNPAFIAGDFNASLQSKNDVVFKYLTECGYISTYKLVNGSSNVITHRTHRHTLLGVDFIFQSPNSIQYFTELQKAIQAQTRFQMPTERLQYRQPQSPSPAHSHSSVPSQSFPASPRSPTSPTDFAPILHMKPVGSELLPSGADPKIWPKEFTLSDHRMVRTNFEIVLGKPEQKGEENEKDKAFLQQQSSQQSQSQSQSPSASQSAPVSGAASESASSSSAEPRSPNRRGLL